jgi:hypothetical protein
MSPTKVRAKPERTAFVSQTGFHIFLLEVAMEAGLAFSSFTLSCSVGLSSATWNLLFRLAERDTLESSILGVKDLSMKSVGDVHSSRAECNLVLC